MPALPRTALASSLPSLSSRLSISVSTRETKNEATERIVDRSTPCLLGLLQAGQVGIHHLAVAVDGEDQRDVDADALSEVASVIEGSPASVAGILIITFGRSTSHHSAWASAEVLSVSWRDPRVDLDGDPAVLAVGGVVGRAQHVAGPADVEGGEQPDRLLQRHAANGQVMDLLGVGRVALGRAFQGLLEDRRVAGHADHMLVVDQLLQVAGDQAVPADVVQPDRYAVLGQVLQCVAHDGFPSRKWRSVGEAQLPVVLPVMMLARSRAAWAGRDDPVRGETELLEQHAGRRAGAEVVDGHDLAALADESRASPSGRRPRR